MKIDAGKAFFGIEIPLERFAPLAADHLARVKDTAAIEARGKLLIKKKFPKTDVADFVRRVCAWGGYAGVSGRVLKRNELVEIRGSLVEAHQQLMVSAPDIASALRAINRIRGLGRLSFASKHLRFLCPELCPVFDSFLQSALPYSFDVAGYASFASDCSRLAAELTRLAVRNPRPGRNGRWFVADTEASIYEYVRQRVSR